MRPLPLYVSLILLALCIVGFGTYTLYVKETTLPVDDQTPTVETPEKSTEVAHAVIGTSVEGRTIDAYTYGDGDTNLLFVGGIHGGYEWNSVLLAYEMMDH